MLAAAAPPEQRISPNVDGEFDDIVRLLDQSGRRDVTPEEIRHCSNPLFTATLVASQPDLLHIAMHGDTTSLFFERADPRDHDLLSREPARGTFSRQRIVPYEYLAGVIVDVGTVRTAILSVCYSANSDETRTSFAHMLVEQGVPSAIGMNCNITPNASREFCQELYRGICGGEPIADSYANAIISLRRMSTFEECLWSVPMLYGSDNVIPLPTDGYRRFLNGVEQAVTSIEELRRNLSRLSMQVGSRPDNWRVDSTLTAMGLGRALRGLAYLGDNLAPHRVDSYIWRLEFDVGRAEVDRKISMVRAAMSEVSEAAGPAAVSRASLRFRAAAERLLPELDNMHRLVRDEFPASPVSTPAKCRSNGRGRIAARWLRPDTGALDRGQQAATGNQPQTLQGETGADHQERQGPTVGGPQRGRERAFSGVLASLDTGVRPAPDQR